MIYLGISIIFVLFGFGFLFGTFKVNHGIRKNH